MQMNEDVLEKSFVEWCIRITDSETKEKCLDAAKQMDEKAKWYQGIIDHYQAKVDHYKDLQRIVKNAAAANRKRAEELSSNN